MRRLLDEDDVIEAISSEPLFESGMKKRDADAVVPVIYEKIKSLPSAQAEQQHGRIFQGVVVEYPEYCTYPEYKGKPYFSIKYTENGQKFIGYGTYKPEVLSEFLKEYFMLPAQPESDKEQLSRLIRAGIIATDTKDVYSCGMRNGMRWCRSLLDDKEPKFEDASQYAQQERKKGKWINIRHDNIAECDQCGITGRAWMNFCFDCGADMMEETK